MRPDAVSIVEATERRNARTSAQSYPLRAGANSLRATSSGLNSPSGGGHASPDVTTASSNSSPGQS